MDKLLEIETADSTFLLSILNSISDGVMVAHRDGRILLMNPAAQKITGISSTDEPFDKWSQLFGCYLSEDQTPFPTEELPLVRAMRGEVTGETEMFLNNPNLPHPVWISILGRPLEDIDAGAVSGGVSCSVSPLRNSEGLPTGAVIVARDITARLLAENALAESNQRLQLAVLSANVGIWSWDTRAGALMWDERMCAIFGKLKEDNPQKTKEFFDITVDTFMESVHPEDRAKVSEALAKVLDQNSNYECSYRIIWTDSTLRFIEASGVLCFDPDGERSKMIGICTDVTERKTMEKNIREINRRREQIAGAIVQHAPVGIVTLDSYLRITDVNSAFATMARRRIKELLMKPLGAVLPEQIFHKAQESIKSGSSFQIFRYKIDLPAESSQRSNYWDLSFWPVLSSQGSTDGAILQVADCTAAVMLEEQREDFVAAVAHDIKNPLIGAGRLLDHLCSQTEAKSGNGNHEMMTMLRDSNGGLLALVQNLVDVHQYETLGYPIVCTEVNLRDTMDSCIKQNRYLSDSRQVTIHLSEMSAPLIISADYIGLCRVFMNLLHNAVKFSKPGSAVEVALRRIDLANVEISVSDTGDGISTADQMKLFQRYGQAEAGKRKDGSTGLGLYLSRQIIQGHRGQIGCNSEVGVGSTFFVRLPINQQDQNMHTDQTYSCVVAKIA